MPKDIKIKEKDNHSIRKLDRSIAFTSRVKRSMSKQYEKLKQDKNNNEDIENSSATNYATTKVMRTSDRGARGSAYVIYGTSKTAYKKAKMKLAENKAKKKETLNQQEQKQDDFSNKRLDQTSHNSRQERVNKTRISNTKTISDVGKSAKIKDYQKKKLIKEKQDFKNIKEHNYKSVGIKTNNNSLKIKTRENAKGISNLKVSANNIKMPTSNDLMKKSKLQSLNQNTGKIKNTTKKVGKVVVNIGRKAVQRTKRSRNINCFWWRFSFNDNYNYPAYNRNVWLRIRFFILK